MKYLNETDKIENLKIVLSHNRRLNILEKSLAEKYTNDCLFDVDQNIDKYDLGLFSSGALVLKNNDLIPIEFRPQEESPDVFFRRIKTTK
ncbi:MAG: hypothetical protein K9H62_23070 [Bacteroidales bacterium]|nr:hypothetical protein [Bacteroidales bacterium]